MSERSIQTTGEASVARLKRRLDLCISGLLSEVFYNCSEIQLATDCGTR
jgi:hypothetical protein